MKRSFVRTLLSFGFLSSAAFGLLVGTESSASAYNGCSGSDCIIYDLSTQDSCTEVQEGPTWDSRWAGLSRTVDQALKGGSIVAYQIQWSTSGWTGWLVPGVNDIDFKYNPGPNTLRRMWSYFYDHNHRYIICTKTPGAY